MESRCTFGGGTSSELMKRKVSAKKGNEEEPPEGFLNMRETAASLKVPAHFMTRVKKSGAPFYDGKTRPEWIMEWVHKNANDEARRKNCCNECMFFYPRSPGNDTEAGIEFEI